MYIFDQVIKAKAAFIREKMKGSSIYGYPLDDLGDNSDALLVAAYLLGQQRANEDDAPRFLPGELERLEQFISATEKFSRLGVGIHTYPNGDDRQQRIFQGCLELERLGRIKRTTNTPTYVFFVPVDSHHA